MSFFIQVFDLRHFGGLAMSEIFSVEIFSISAFLSFVMKLNEKQFKPVLDALLNWMFDDTSALARQTTGFHILSDLAQKLKSLFVGYVPAFLDKAVELCCTEMGKRPWTDQHADAQNQNSYLAKFFVVQCLYRSLVYDEDNLLHQQTMDKIITAAIKLLRKCQHPSKMFLDGIGELQDADLSFTGDEMCHSDMLSKAVAAILIHLGTVSNFQKSVTNKVQTLLALQS